MSAGPASRRLAAPAQAGPALEARDQSLARSRDENPDDTLSGPGAPGAGNGAAPQELHEAALGLQAQLGALRQAGACRFDPVRFHAMESLARRLPDQPEPVRCLLQGRLRAALAEFAARWAEARQGATVEVTRLVGDQPALARQLQGLLAAGDLRGIQRLGQQPLAPAAALPLQQLNQYIRASTLTDTAADPGAAAPDALPAQDELTSARRFRQAWTRSRIADRVALAVSRPPANAGPLNSHRLLLQALDRMRELSPDYLQHFVAQAESLQWLARAGEQYPPTPSGAARPARRGRAKK